MSVPKGKRNESKIEFERLFMRVADDVDNFVEHDFFAEDGIIAKNLDFILMRKQTIEKLSDELIYHIRIANSIYPQNMTEFEERRLSMGKAIGVCYSILTHYQRILMRLRVPDDKYVNIVSTLSHTINSFKVWRKSIQSMDMLYKRLSLPAVFKIPSFCRAYLLKLYI